MKRAGHTKKKRYERMDQLKQGGGKNEFKITILGLIMTRTKTTESN